MGSEVKHNDANAMNLGFLYRVIVKIYQAFICFWPKKM